MKRNRNVLAGRLLGGSCAMALGVVLGVGAVAMGNPAFAQGHDDGGSHQGGGQGPGGPGGGHDGGHDDGHDGGHDDGHGGGGPGSGGQGPGQPGGNPNPGAGQGQGGGRGQGAGGRPPWAQEGIPEVELGRLNVARAPVRVLDRAYAEVLNTITPAMVDFYNLDLDAMIMELSTNWDGISLVDSPLQNLALLRDALEGSSALAVLGVANDLDTLMAAFLGTASDKNLPITTETALAVSILLGHPLSAAAEAAALAADAERIRIAILAGHG